MKRIYSILLQNFFVTSDFFPAISNLASNNSGFPPFYLFCGWLYMGAERMRSLAFAMPWQHWTLFSLSCHSFLHSDPLDFHGHQWSNYLIIHLFAMFYPFNKFLLTVLFLGVRHYTNNIISGVMVLVFSRWKRGNRHNRSILDICIIQEKKARKEN